MFALSLTKYFKLNENLAFDYLPYSIFIAVILLFIDIGFNLTGINYNEGLRIITSSNIRHLGHIVIVSTLYLSIKILVTDKSDNLLFMALSATSISLLIWLGGKGAILSYVLGLTVALITIYKKNRLKVKGSLKLVYLIVVSVIISLPLNIYSWNGLNRLTETENYYRENVNSLSSNRIILWNESWGYIKEKPILGYGSESFILNSESGYRHPHNVIVQWLLDFGFLGTLIFLVLITYVIVTGYKKQDSLLNTYRLIAMSCFLALISNALISGTLYYSPPFFIVCITISFIITNCEFKNREKL
ncbi:O-Antigen ligase [Vibrio sp. B1FLJ16]|uniref:O-antigen ligase family protein n=1 Tax=Vibrio sp. B1FLJ16 TaxID=2751178 RepID=UPI0015F65931|nr:O-antigen ligase family protein [Vibrio sp. B1FLJ16]CAD7810172.1 O-Antigen ligase [Vibrio sp. B1FLJ16]CAE6911583.1 O-Antigen ligase [Vibrio sp. B1FLJ16]